MVTGKVIVPIWKTLVPPNPTNGVSEGRKRSLSTLICWNAGQQRIFAELPLSTSTCQILKFAIDKLMTRASSWGWCSRLASSSVKLMAGLLTLVALEGRLEIWILCTIRKYVFLAFLNIVFPLMITLISPSRALDLSSACQLGSRSLERFFPPLTNRYKFPCLMRVSIYCLRLQHSKVSCLWSRWKRQYLFLSLLFESPFNLSSQFNAALSLICIRT